MVGPFTFTTLGCSNTFAVRRFFNGFPNACWDQAGDGDPGMTSSMGTSSWFTDGLANVGTTGAVKVNLHNRKTEWILSPNTILVLGDHTDEFDFGVFTWNQTTPGVGSDDRVEVLISRNGGGS